MLRRADRLGGVVLRAVLVVARDEILVLGMPFDVVRVRDERAQAEKRRGTIVREGRRSKRPLLRFGQRHDLFRTHGVTSRPRRRERLLAEGRLRIGDRPLVDLLLEGVA